jgi:hypothetical protein
MSNTPRYELDNDAPHVLHPINDDIPEAPESWTLDDFDDLLDPHRREFHPTARDAWV